VGIYARVETSRINLFNSALPPRKPHTREYIRRLKMLLFLLRKLYKPNTVCYVHGPVA